MFEFVIKIPKYAEIRIENNNVKFIYNHETKNKLFIKITRDGKVKDNKELVVSKNDKLHLQL